MFFYLFVFVFLIVASIFLWRYAVFIFLLFKRGMNLKVLWFLCIETAVLVIPVIMIKNFKYETSTYIIGSILLGMFIPSLGEIISAGNKKKNKYQSHSKKKRSLASDSGWSFSGDSGGDCGDSGGDGGGCD